MGQNLVREDSVRENHTADAINNDDPDDGKSWPCSACTLPIFSTPFISRGKLFLHDCCADLPDEFTSHVLHRNAPLVRKSNQISAEDSFSCSQCKRKCGSMMYECPDRDCGFKLDLLCTVHVTIMHRSHPNHRLMAITGSASFVCGACGTQHTGLSDLSYLCNACDFWIHPDCASLPNVITLNKYHKHSLYLTYHLSTPSGIPVQVNCTCAICGGDLHSAGVYFCAGCGYYAHIGCAVSGPRSFEPVLFRDAKLAGLLHFPMADEQSSLMPYIMEDTSDHEVDQYESKGEIFRENLHQHPLIFDDGQDEDDDESSRVCNACVQLISSGDPFYRCSRSDCPDFFLHRCCANLASTTKHHTHDHTLSLLAKSQYSSTSGTFLCQCCLTLSNGFAYSCNTCDDFSMDVVCAMMPPSITHHLHAKSHIFFMSNDPADKVFRNSVKKFIESSYERNDPDFKVIRNFNKKFIGPSYECSTCRNFRILIFFVQLPSSTNHKFDEHPLKLTTPRDDPLKGQEICEICEDDISSDYWYSCGECEQWFHCECIHGFSKFKLGGTIRVKCHDCPLTLIPESTIYGYRCGYCQKVFESSGIYYQQPAYECSKCFFRIHDECAGKCLLSE